MREIKPKIQDKIGAQVLFTLTEVRYKVLNAEMLMTKSFSSSNRFDPLRGLYIKASKFNIANKKRQYK
jgi:thiamine pyrophosphokinase